MSPARVIRVYGCFTTEPPTRWWGPPDVPPPALPEGHVWLDFGNHVPKR